MNKAEALEKLKKEGHQVPPLQAFEICPLRPGDAWGVARIFYAMYGDRYPVDTYYLPDRLVEENAAKNILSVTARTASGDIIGHGAIYRSSAPCAGTYEIGQFMVLPHYRKTRAFLKIQNYLLHTTVPSEGIDTLFGESVCHHVITQKYFLLAGFHETAIEVGLMPASTYERSDFPGERISTLLAFMTLREKRHVTYVPGEYDDALSFILTGMGLDRELRKGSPTVPCAERTAVTTEFFDTALVARAQVTKAGYSFEDTIEHFEARASGKGMKVIQCFVNLGEESSAYAVRVLRSRGYFLGGFLPRWFDTDGLLLQKAGEIPARESIRLASDRSRRLLELIGKDMEAVSHGGGNGTRSPGTKSHPGW